MNNVERTQDSGTLGVSPWDQDDFLGSNEHAFVDGDCTLYGISELEQLHDGLVICLPAIPGDSFNVFVEHCWDDFAKKLERELNIPHPIEADIDEAMSMFRRIKFLVSNRQHRAAFDGGGIKIPRDILDEANITSASEVLVIGNTGHFEVWNKGSFERMREDISLLDILAGDGDSASVDDCSASPLTYGVVVDEDGGVEPLLVKNSPAAASCLCDISNHPYRIGRDAFLNAVDVALARRFGFYDPAVAKRNGLHAIHLAGCVQDTSDDAFVYIDAETADFITGGRYSLSWLTRCKW